MDVLVNGYYIRQMMMIVVGYCFTLGRDEPLGKISGNELLGTVSPWGDLSLGGIFYFLDFVTDALALTERILIDGLLQIWNLRYSIQGYLSF